MDVNIYPGYKGFLNFHSIYYNYLRDQARIKAVGIDSMKLLDEVVTYSRCVRMGTEVSS